MVFYVTHQAVSNFSQSVVPIHIQDTIHIIKWVYTEWNAEPLQDQSSCPSLEPPLGADQKLRLHSNNIPNVDEGVEDCKSSVLGPAQLPPLLSSEKPLPESKRLQE